MHHYNIYLMQLSTNIVLQLSCYEADFQARRCNPQHYWDVAFLKVSTKPLIYCSFLIIFSLQWYNLHPLIWPEFSQWEVEHIRRAPHLWTLRPSPAVTHL